MTEQTTEPERPALHMQRQHPLGMKAKKSNVVAETVQEDTELFEKDPRLPVYKPYYKQLPGKATFSRKW
jgi:hypothetical protein